MSQGPFLGELVQAAVCRADQPEPAACCLEVESIISSVLGRVFLCKAPLNQCQAASSHGGSKDILALKQKAMSACTHLQADT